MGTKVNETRVDLIKSSDLSLAIPPVATIGTSEQFGTSKSKNNEHFHKDEHETNQRVSNGQKILTSLAAGAVAGAVAKTVIAPLDRTKINFQISNTRFSARRAMKFIIAAIRNEGVCSLWRGNTATMARIIPYAAIQYAAHEQYKTLLNRDRRKKHLSPGLRFLAGSLAGVTSVTCTYPLDMVRARMAVTAKEKYHNLPEVFMKIYREERFKTLWRGYTPTVLGAIPYSGISFFTYETCKKLHAEVYKGEDPSPVHRLCFGATAGLLGQSASYPLDIVRRRMQTAEITGHTKEYVTIWNTASSVIKEEGFIQGMYKGLSLNWIKGPIAVGVSFTVFDITQRQLRKLYIFQCPD